MITTYTLNDSALLAASDALSVPDGGFTLDPRTLTPVRGGYAVSIDPDASEVLSSASVGDLLAYLVRWSDVLDQPDAVFGGWRDPADDRIYLDVSRVIDDRDTAIELAIEHGTRRGWLIQRFQLSRNPGFVRGHPGVMSRV